jgi:hypothetical protein
MNTARRLRVLAGITALSILTASSSSVAQSQGPSSLSTGKIDVRVLHAIHEPEEATVSYVSVGVTIRSAGDPFVVPKCSESGRPQIFCMASLQRANGKVVPVRKHLAATLGFLVPEYWKAVHIPANGETDFQFSIDMGLLDVHPGDKVRLAFWTWPDDESMKDEKQGKMIFTPVFRIPLKPE